MGDVYFLEAEGQGKVKIGISENVDERIKNLSGASPVPLKLRAIIRDGGRETELRLHDRFSHLRLHGEWFRYTKELKQFIDQRALTTDREQLEKLIERSPAVVIAICDAILPVVSNSGFKIFFCLCRDIIWDDELCSYLGISTIVRLTNLTLPTVISGYKELSAKGWLSVSKTGPHNSSPLIFRLGIKALHAAIELCGIKAGGSR